MNTYKGKGLLWHLSPRAPASIKNGFRSKGEKCIFDNRFEIISEGWVCAAENQKLPLQVFYSKMSMGLIPHDTELYMYVFDPSRLDLFYFKNKMDQIEIITDYIPYESIVYYNTSKKVFGAEFQPSSLSQHESGNISSHFMKNYALKHYTYFRKAFMEITPQKYHNNYNLGDREKNVKQMISAINWNGTIPQIVEKLNIK